MDSAQQVENKKQRKTIKVISTRKFRYHSNSKKCSECGKEFSDKYIMITHKKTQHGIKPHSCKKCQETFNTMKELKDHIRIDHLNYEENDLNQIKQQQNPKNYPKYQKKQSTNLPLRELRPRKIQKIEEPKYEELDHLEMMGDVATLNNSIEVSEDLSVHSSSTTQIIDDEIYEEKQVVCQKKQKKIQQKNEQQIQKNKFIPNEEFCQKLLQIANKVMGEECQKSELQQSCQQNCIC